MKKPPPSRLRQQEPPYQSPPRTPPPLHQQELPYLSMPRTPPPLHQQDPPYQSPPRPPPPLHQQEPSYLSLLRTPPPLRQQQPSYQSPPRPPPPLHEQERSYQSPPRPPPPLRQQERSQAPRRRGPVISRWNQQRHHQPPTSSIPRGDDGPLKRRRFNLEVGRFNGVGGMGRVGGDELIMFGRGGVSPSDFGQQDLVGRPSRERLPLPPDASNTLLVEGLPPNCSMREVAHIFRPFLGYKEVRLVTKDSQQRNGDPIVQCFVDYENPARAATARNALQGYIMDEEEPDSKILQIQFSRNPGPRPEQR